MDKRGAVIENKVHEPQTVVKGHLYGNVKKKKKTQNNLKITMEGYVPKSFT